MDKTTLSSRMLDRARFDNLPETHPVVVAAKAFDNAWHGLCADPPTHTIKAMLGAWARARLAWREYSGEDLI